MNKYFLIMIFGSFLASISQVMLKSSANFKHKNILKEYINLKVIISYALLGTSLFINVYAYRGVPYKYAPVFAAITYTFSLIFSKVVLGEETKSKLLGNIIILSGILVSLMNF